MRPSNPYHIYPVYDRDNDLSKLGYYSAPTYRTMSFQFSRTGTATVSAFDLVTTDGTVLGQDVSEIATFAENGGKTFYWSQGNNLSNPPQSGTMYRPRITLTGGIVYWGHMICANAIFDIAYPTLRINTCSSNTILLDATYPNAANVQIKVEDANSSFETTIDVANPEFDITQLTPSGLNYSATVTITSYLFSGNGGARRLSVAYPLTSTITDVCGDALLGTGVQTGLEEINTFELTIFNSTDVQSQEILYSQGFRQKMWFVGEFLDPIPRITENYLENGENAEFFQSARTAEAQVVEFWPCPDRAALGLPFAKYNSSVILNGAGSSYTLYRLLFEPVVVENEARPKGRITAEFDGAFVQSLMSNYESA